MKQTQIIWQIIFISLILTTSFVRAAVPTYTVEQIQQIKNQAHLTYQDNIPIIVLSGNKLEMGIQYGANLQNQLIRALDIIKYYYITQKRISYDELVRYSDILYNSFPEGYQDFIQGISIGVQGKLSVNDLKILNAMETLVVLLKPHADLSTSSLSNCAFAYVPKNITTTGGNLIGRNYDYSKPYDKLAKYLIITILKEPHKVSTAIISMAGQIYCPSCINKDGIFMELNNGGPSGGFYRNVDTQTLLIKMLDTLQNAGDISDVEHLLNNQSSDYSLIVNVADNTHVLNLEYSTNTNLGMRIFYPDISQPFVSTNYYINSMWGNKIAQPNDINTWMGVTRHNNLLNLINQIDDIDISKFKQIMETKITNGGALWEHTIYQLIIDENTLDLYVRVLSNLDEWQKIPLKQYLNT